MQLVFHHLIHLKLLNLRRARIYLLCGLMKRRERDIECDGTFNGIFGDAANGLVRVMDEVEEKRKLKYNPLTYHSTSWNKHTRRITALWIPEILPFSNSLVVYVAQLQQHYI
jgi:hypothetical protein